MSIDLTKADEKNAKLKLTLKADSGFNSIMECRVSANQWAAISAVCHDTLPAPVALAGNDLLAALETAMQWIKAWDVGFLFDDEWPADEAKIAAAIAKAKGEQG